MSYLIHPTIIDTINTPSPPTPHILLLQEDMATGGVTTIANTLSQALQQQGWPVTTLALDQSGWGQRLATARQSDIILASNNFRPAYVAWVVGLLLHKPVVVWVHGPLQEVLAQAHASAAKRAWLRWLYRRLPRFVFVSQASRDSFQRFMGGQLKPDQSMAVIANAVTLHATGTNTLAATTAALEDAKLACIGRLSPEKQPLLLLAMLRLLPSKYQLTLIGDGPLRNALTQEGADLLVSGRLTLAGPQAHGPGLYAPWTLTLLASRYEGCPMTLLESLAMGVPCVGLPIPALQEVLGQDAPYLLARDHSARALADAVQAVMKLPPAQLQADMAQVLERHQLNDFVQRWQTVLQQAVRPC